MTSDKRRRARVGKATGGRKQRSPGIGKGRLRATRRERKLSAGTDLLQTSEAAERGEETAAEAAVRTPAKKAAGITAAQAAAPRDIVVAGDVTRGPTGPSGSTGLQLERDGPNSTSAKDLDRPTRRSKAKADAAEAAISTQAVTGAEGEAAPAALSTGQHSRRRADETAQPRRPEKDLESAGSARKKGAQAGGARRAGKDAVKDAAKDTASAPRRRRDATDARRVIIRSPARSHGQPNEASAGILPADSASPSSESGKASRGDGATPSGNKMTAAAAVGVGSSPADPLPFSRAPNSFALAQQAAEIGAAALRDVAMARTLPELVQAQLHCGRAASEVWVHQLRIAASIFLVPAGPWWPSPDTVAASLRE